MTIYIRNRNNKWIKSIDNYKPIFNVHIWVAHQRWWQLLIASKHIVLGFYYGYEWKNIKTFVLKHINQNLNGKK